jgi:hypothetical protein
MLCNQPTNGIGFLALNLPIDSLPEKLWPLLPIFSGLLTQVGTDKSSYVELAQKIEAVSGGISSRTSLLEDPQDHARYTASFEIKGKALVRNAKALCELLGEILHGVDFSDIGRIRQVLDQLRISLSNSVPSSGHSYAARAAAAYLSPAARLRELWSGLEQVSLVQKLSAQDDDQLKQTAEGLQQIAGLLFTRKGLQVALTAEAEQFQTFTRPLATLLGSLKEDSPGGQLLPALAAVPQRQGWIFSVPVNYVTRVFAAPAYTHPDSAALTVLAKLLRAEFLHREIREKGGAYGGMAGYNAEAGIFSLLSYRDPHLARTLQVYDDAITWVLAGNFSDEVIKESILAVFSDLDRPLSPSGNGAREFANRRQGLTLELRNQMRRRLLSVDRAQLSAVAKRWLTHQESSAVSVLAGEEALKAYNAAHPEQPLELKRL